VIERGMGWWGRGEKEKCISGKNSIRTGDLFFFVGPLECVEIYVPVRQALDKYWSTPSMSEISSYILTEKHTPAYILVHTLKVRNILPHILYISM